MAKNKEQKYKRIREKKFTKKRNPYKTYTKADWIWSDIFNEINLLKITDRSYLKIIASKYNINYNTLKYKYNKNKKDNMLNINTENRGTKKALTLEQASY